MFHQCFIKVILHTTLHIALHLPEILPEFHPLKGEIYTSEHLKQHAKGVHYFK
jgi:hypothetical protein